MDVQKMEDLKKNKEKEGKNQKDYAFYPDGKKKKDFI